MSNNDFDPQTGDGVTICWYTDRYACTVFNRTPRQLTVRRDKATLLNGHGSGEPDALVFSPGGLAGHCEGKQRYSYETDPGGECYYFSLRKNGKWVMTGCRMQDGTHLTAGRNEFYDFNF